MPARCPVCGDKYTPAGLCESCRLARLSREELDDPLPRADGRVRAPRVPLPARSRHSGTLPDPLDDPMRGLRKFFLWLMVVGLVVAMAACAILVAAGVSTGGGVSFGIAAVVLVGFAASLWRILPARETDVLYLRSFRYDRATARVRTELQRAFGRHARVSGIRDPRRRWPKWLRYPLLAAFALRYATPKYMNLEAGDAWKERLWRSLGRARGAVIDVTDLTAYVLEEVRLCERCLGLDRILFVGDASKSAREWCATILRALDRPVHADSVRVAIWGRSSGARQDFRRRAADFASDLPTDPAGSHDAAGEWARLSEELRDVPYEPASRLWLELLLGFIGSFAIFQTLGLLDRLGNGGEGIGIVLYISVAIWLIQVWFFILYLKDCGSGRERLLASVTMGIVLLIPVLAALTIPAVLKVRDAAARMLSANDLKQIGLAFQTYHDENGSLPAANGARAQRPGERVHPISWRLELLPYLSPKDEKDLQNFRDILQGYRRSEPWDSPHNLQFVDKMPKVFRHPLAGQDTPNGHTHYRVFVTPLNSAGPSAVFRDRVPGPSLVSLSVMDGTSNTILAVEAAEAVPWTKPEGLEFDASKPLPKLGGFFRVGGYNALLADGSVRFFLDETPEARLRSHITRDGGEEIRDD